MKKTLLVLCAGVFALCASAKTYKVGEAFCYPISDGSFVWFDNDEDVYAENDNWPAITMQGAASMSKGYGLGMLWFAQYNPGSNPGPVAGMQTLAEAQAICPVVEDPWNRGDKAIKLQAEAWWAFGNFNFALPKVDEVCRIRVIYRVDITGLDRYQPANNKPFHVRLTNSSQEGCFTPDEPDPANGQEMGPIFEEQVGEYWDNPGYRVIDLYYNLPTNQTYLALTFDGLGLSCARNTPFYLEEVSVVPVSKLEGDTHKSGETVTAITETRPELVIVEGVGEDSINEIAVEAKAEGIYDLAGRKLAAPVKGINIINGVKTLVK